MKKEKLQQQNFNHMFLLLNSGAYGTTFGHTPLSFNSLAPGQFEWNFTHEIFKQILVIHGWGISGEIALIMNVTGLHWWSVNTGSGNGLVPSGNKSLPEPMLTQISVAISHH